MTVSKPVQGVLFKAVTPRRSGGTLILTFPRPNPKGGNSPAGISLGQMAPLRWSMTSPRLINGITLATAIATYVRRAGLRHDSLLSHVRAAVREASGVADRHALLQVDIRPYLEALPDIAYKQALREGRSKPANHRSSAMRFIDVVLERTRDPHCERTSRRRGGRAAFLPAWWPLFDALWVRAGRNVPKGAASLETLQGLALRHGVRDPERLPDAFHTVAGWCSEAGLRDQMRTEILSVYRRARVAADRLDLPEIAPPRA